MRALATLSAAIAGVLALSLTSCGVAPDSKFDGKAELAKLKGPETGTIEGTIRSQAEQAETAGDFKRAAQLYKQLTDKYPDKEKYQLGLAGNLRRAGDCATALRVTDALVKKNPANAEALENKGLCLMATGEFAEAGEVFGKVMKADPGRWRTLNGIGILFAMKGKYEGAHAYYKEALTVSTDNPSVLNNMALTYAINRQFKESYATFDRAKRHLPPESPDVKHLDLNLALVYAVGGRLDDAERTAAPHLSKAALYNNMGFYSYLAKNNELAKGYLNMALTQSPTYYERAWKNMGALTGDTSSNSGEAQAMPARMVPDEGYKPAPGIEQEAASTAAPLAGVPLEDIPELKPLHSSDASPYAGTDEPQPGVAMPPGKVLKLQAPQPQPAEAKDDGDKVKAAASTVQAQPEKAQDDAGKTSKADTSEAADSTSSKADAKTSDDKASDSKASDAGTDEDAVPPPVATHSP